MQEVILFSFNIEFIACTKQMMKCVCTCTPEREHVATASYPDVSLLKNLNGRTREEGNAKEGESNKLSLKRLE